MPATPAWLAAIESALNLSIGRSQPAGAAARRLDGTSLQVDIEGIGRLRAAVCGERLALTAGRELAAGTATRTPEAAISGAPLALLRLFNEGGGRATGAISDRSGAPTARISGDAQIAAAYRELFALARPDLEEELSRLIGDLPARRLSLAAQGAVGWALKAARTAGANLAEYLQEESRDLAGKYEVEEFIREVDRLRDTADRVEARLARIEQRLEDAG